MRGTVLYRASSDHYMFDMLQYIVACDIDPLIVLQGILIICILISFLTGVSIMTVVSSLVLHGFLLYSITQSTYLFSRYFYQCLCCRSKNVKKKHHFPNMNHIVTIRILFVIRDHDSY